MNKWASGISNGSYTNFTLIKGFREIDKSQITKKTLLKRKKCVIGLKNPYKLITIGIEFGCKQLKIRIYGY